MKVILMLYSVSALKFDGQFIMSKCFSWSVIASLMFASVYGPKPVIRLMFCLLVCRMISLVSSNTFTLIFTSSSNLKL